MLSQGVLGDLAKLRVGFYSCGQAPRCGSDNGTGKKTGECGN